MMSRPPSRNGKINSSPLPSRGIVDLYFLDARAKLIEIAAFLDRVERAAAVHGESAPDFRMESLKKGLALVAGKTKDKAKAVQMIFSDPTEAPLASAAGMKGAVGAYDSRRKSEPQSRKAKQ